MLLCLLWIIPRAHFGSLHTDFTDRLLHVTLMSFLDTFHSLVGSIAATLLIDSAHSVKPICGQISAELAL